MKRKNLLLLCVIALVAICLASCTLVENLPGSDSLPGCIELFGSHNVKHVDAKDATCAEAGNIEYWYCDSCGTVWSDSALTQQITKESTVIAKIDHEYTYACDAICAACGELTNEEAEHTIAHVNAKDATCAEPGNIEYWYCTDCGYAWADAALTKVTNLKSVIIPELECNTVHFDAVAPACHYNGNIEYWVCYDCERVWQDEALTQLTNIKNVVLPATGNGLLVHMEATEAGCHSNGCIEHWICYTCEQVWQDEALTQLTNIKNVILPATGEGLLVHMDAVAPGCHYTGIVEHWICYECNGVWTDEALTQVSNVKSVIIPELGADVIHVDAKAPTCNELGNIEYWYCETCEQVWQDEARTQLTNFMNVKLGTIDHEYFYACDAHCMNCGELTNEDAAHTIKHIDAVEATCQSMGNLEYWYCEICGNVWTDEALTQQSNRFNVVTFVDHEYFYACDAHCMNCGELTNPEAAHNVEYHAAVVPTCQNDGFQEYWQCTECFATWADEDLTIQTVPFRLWIPAEPCTPEYACESKCQWCFATIETEGHKATLVPAVESTCTKNGNIAHYTCAHCGKLWYDKELTQSLSKNEVTLPLAAHEYRFECDAWCMNCYELTNEYAYHNIVLVEAKAPTCIAFGNIEHYACTYCAGCWDNAEGTGMPLNKMMVNISKVEHEALSPCYPECKWCFQPVFENNGHDVKHVEAKDKTCLEAGCLEHWICVNCNTVWVDEALTETVRYADVMIPTLGYHTYNFECDSVCAVCLLETRPENTHDYFNKCDKVCMYCYEITNPTADHKIAHVDALDPTCHQVGNVEYWYCTDCGTAWTDETLRYQTNLKSVILPATVGLTYVEAVEVSCHQNGRQEYWYCADCNAIFSDAQGRYLTNYLNLTIPYTAEIVNVEAVEATCHQTGLVEHWYCVDCLAVFTDAALTQLSNFKSVVTPALTDLVYVPAVEVACHQNGRQEYWYCADCNAIFSDAAGRYLTNYLNLTIPYTAEIVHVEAVEGADCQTLGNVEHWYCAECEAVFTDAALTKISNFQSVKVYGPHSYFYACDPVCMVCYELTNPEATHTLTHVAAVSATCTVNGNVEYWACSDCGGCWDNANATGMPLNRFMVVVPALGHDYKAVVTAPTCTKVGYTTHTCVNCDDEYTDSEVAATGHTGLEDLTCDGCKTFITPDAGSTLTIKQALILAEKAGTSYTSGKYYVTGRIKNVYNTTYGNMYIVDEEGNELCIYGLYSADGKTRYDKMSYKPVEYDEVTVYGVLGMYNTTKQMKSGWLDEVVAHECNEYTEATCKTLASCVVCGKTTGKLADHNYDGDTCTVCGDVKGATQSYVKVTNASEFTSGTYVLIVTSKNVTMSTFSGSWVKGSALSAGESISKATGDSLAITLEVSDTGVKIKIGGKYIAPKGGNENGIKESAYTWAYEFKDDGTIIFKGTGSDTVYLAYNVQSAGFRGYKTSTVNGNTSGYPYTFVAYKLSDN